jgi:NAD(P)-dependent dehydrogenase (short-subunit alcohol dehydrogenase family)
MDRGRVLVVGGLTGIGAAVVAELGEERCVVWSRRTGVDATDARAVAGATQALLAQGAPWAWVHAVGDFDERPALASDQPFVDAMFASNLTTAWNVMRALVPAMQAKGGGRIVFFGAAGVDKSAGLRRAPAYFAAKAALLTLTRALALDLAAHRITVNMISPGIIRHATSHAQSQARMAPRVPAGRAGTPRDVAGAVRFLLSDDGAYVTGVNLEVDGGLALT